MNKLVLVGGCVMIGAGVGGIFAVLYTLVLR